MESIEFVNFIPTKGRHSNYIFHFYLIKHGVRVPQAVS